MSHRSEGTLLSHGATEVRWRNEETRIRDAYGRRGNLARYSWFNRAHLLGMQEIEAAVLKALWRHGVTSLEDVRLLDVGCGTAVWIREFIKWGAQPQHIYGLDLLDDRILEAGRLCPAGVTLACGSAADLHFENSAFDLVLQSMLFSSVLDSEMRRRIAAEMLRVVKPNGLVLWYDHRYNNPRNADVRRITKEEMYELFPTCDIEFERLTLAPPLARLVAPRSSALYRALGSIPSLRTHYLAVIRKRATGA
jgi:ubiquinone/menaquinone biosynthesis C-methylase UbiE